MNPTLSLITPHVCVLLEVVEKSHQNKEKINKWEQRINKNKEIMCDSTLSLYDSIFIEGRFWVHLEYCIFRIYGSLLSCVSGSYEEHKHDGERAYMPYYNLVYLWFDKCPYLSRTLPDRAMSGQMSGKQTKPKFIPSNS